MRLLRRRTSFSPGRETDKKVKSEIPVLKIGDLFDFFTVKVSLINYNFTTRKQIPALFVFMVRKYPKTACITVGYLPPMVGFIIIKDCIDNEE